MATPPTIRMVQEYGCSWPFWGEEGLLEQEDFPLPPDLTADVLAWTRNFHAHFDPFEGWPTAEQRETDRREGEQLAKRVQNAVGPETAVHLDLWQSPVDGPVPPRGKWFFRPRSESARAGTAPRRRRRA